MIGGPKRETEKLTSKTTDEQRKAAIERRDRENCSWEEYYARQGYLNIHNIKDTFK